MFQNPVGRQVLLVLALSCLTGLAFFIAYRPLLSARAGIGDESVEQRSISDRVVFAELAYRSISANPLVGLGISNFPWFAAREIRELGYDLKGDNVHQVLLSALAELGMVGYGLMVLALLAGVEAALRYFRTTPNTSERYAKAVLFAGFIALTIIGLLDHYPWSILQFQTAWWGLLAAVLAPAAPIEISRQSQSSL